MRGQNSGLTLTSDLWLLAILVRDVTAFSKSSWRPHSSALKQGTGHSWMWESGGMGHPSRFNCLLHKHGFVCVHVCSHETGLGFAVVWSAGKSLHVRLTHCTDQHHSLSYGLAKDKWRIACVYTWRRVLHLTCSDYRTSRRYTIKNRLMCSKVTKQVVLQTELIHHHVFSVLVSFPWN